MIDDSIDTEPTLIDTLIESDRRASAETCTFEFADYELGYYVGKECPLKPE